MNAPEITTEQLWNVKTPPGVEAIEAALNVYDALEALNAVLDAAGIFEAIGPLRRPWAFRRALETDPAIGAAWAELEARALEARRIGLTKVGGWLAPPEFDAAGHMLFEMATPITRQHVATREKGGPIEMLDHAAEQGYGVPAFNVNNLEQTRAIMEAASQTDSPVIMQASAGARKYAGSNFLKHMILAAIEEFPHIPVVMHQDHGVSPAVCQRSIQLGFSSVMMDGSLGEDGKTPTSYEYNVDVTRRTVEMAHACGVSVEGELGCLGSLETGMAGEEDGIGAEGKLSHDQMLTDPEEAADFVKSTAVDALAIASGTSHGAY